MYVWHPLPVVTVDLLQDDVPLDQEAAADCLQAGRQCVIPALVTANVSIYLLLLHSRRCLRASLCGDRCRMHTVQLNFADCHCIPVSLQSRLSLPWRERCPAVVQEMTQSDNPPSPAIAQCNTPSQQNAIQLVRILEGALRASCYRCWTISVQDHS